ncbi:glycosyltransferase [Croceibacterium sp. LX-88]|uniref:Glycosyltransferase n=1 Tax=Croceibacterium selenioxidans TaxID=2838833 RepID=A0ABS5W5A7_9SPHN|nr:glycosyltransferase [Croceibacterium selenioxidans]MBT2133569.1 glycosyltransferase [Croceibacterium selenioxidans]
MSHIAIYVPSLQGGGAERVMVSVANGLASRGHRVDLVLVKAEGPYLSEVSDRVNVVDLGRGRVIASVWPLICYMRRERPDALLSALFHANFVAIVARLFARVRMRLVVSERNSLASLTGRGSSLILWLMRCLYPRADAIVAVSRGIAEELISELGLAPERVVAIPNPVDVEGIAALAVQRPEHPWLAPDSPPVVVAVGRLEAQKDYPTLLEAFEKVRKRRDVRLVILGEGAFLPELERRIADASLSDTVMLAGFQPNPFGWMAASKAYVLSSVYEGFPNSLIQAMACGVRVVSTNCPTGPDEILEGGKWGTLVPVGDADALADAVVDALDRRTWPDPASMLRKFHPDVIMADFERILT